MTLTFDPRSTLDQRRATHAFQAAERLERIPSNSRDEYAREAKKLPARIVSSGLGQSLAFILAKAKDKKPHLQQLHADLTSWVVQERQIPGVKDPESLMKSLLLGDTDFLRLATDEVLAYLQWLNRFIEAKGWGQQETNQ